MKKYNVGIIGYGWASEAHIEAINATSYAQVNAVWSSRKLDSAAAQPETQMQNHMLHRFG